MEHTVVASRLIMRRAALLHSQSRFLSTTTPPTKKPSSISHSPRFQVPVHIALFTVLMIPVGLSMVYASHYGKTEDDLEAEIRARYQAQMEDSGIAEKNRHMGVYFQQVFHSRDHNPEVEQQLRSILEGGKDPHTKGRQRKYDALGEKLRQTAIAEVPHSTSSLEEEEENNLEDGGASKKKKRKKKKKKKRKVEENAAKDVVPVAVQSGAISSSTVTTMASVTAVAAIAAVTGFILGGSRRSS